MKSVGAAVSWASQRHRWQWVQSSPSLHPRVLSTSDWQPGWCLILYAIGPRSLPTSIWKSLLVFSYRQHLKYQVLFFGLVFSTASNKLFGSMVAKSWLTTVWSNVHRPDIDVDVAKLCQGAYLHAGPQPQWAAENAPSLALVNSIRSHFGGNMEWI